MVAVTGKKTGPRVAALVTALILSVWGVAWAHAHLLSAEPAAGSTVATSPARVRLVFSEALDPSLARVVLVSPAGDTIPLQAAGDPHDVHALIAPITGVLPGGAYKVVWRVVSDDGHPVAGVYPFTVAGGSAASPSATPARASGTSTDSTSIANEQMGNMPGMSMNPGAPPLAAAPRGLGIGAVMAFAGLMLFLMLAPADGSARNSELDHRAATAATILAWAGALLLALHAVLWVEHVSPTGGLSRAAFSAALGSRVGKVELARVAFAVLALWGYGLARRPVIGLLFAVLALGVSGLAGHSGAIDVALTAPMKALHLMAGGAWLGGVLWLILHTHVDRKRFAAEARRVSTIALVSVIVVAVSGIVQLNSYLTSYSQLFHELYGYVALAKIAGLVVLVCFGAYYRQRVLPRLEAEPQTIMRFGGLMRAEVAVMTIVIVLGGLLAYLPPRQ